MMKHKFEEKNLEKCLQLAEKRLSLSRSDFEYTISLEEKGFMKKHCEILVTTKEDEEENEEELKIPDLEDLEGKIKELDGEISTREDGKFQEVLVEEDRIIINEDESNIMKLQFNPEVKIFVNGAKAEFNQEVTSKDEIKYEATIVNGKRELNIKSTVMVAKISIKYTPEYVEKLICKEKNSVIQITSRMAKGKLPPFYTKQEIIGILHEKNIIYGLIEEALDEASSSVVVEDLLVAKGIEVINDEENEIVILFEKTKRIVDEDSKEKVDYRNLYSMANVSAGSILAELKIGKEGQDGMNILGKPISKKLKKNLQLKAANGCKIEDSKVISTIEGQPTIKSGTFYVHQVFQAPSNVDLRSGNINFIGDVKVAKSVLEGMTVESGNSMTIGGNVETATIIAQGETRITGSIINSKINVGSRNMNKQKYVEDLEILCNEIKVLITYANEIKEKNLLGKKSDGEIVKILIENKFKTLPKKAIKILSYDEGEGIEEIKKIIRTKILGIASLNIKYVNELYEFITLIETELQPLTDNLFIPTDVYVNYVQDSEIKATGNIYIIGKGQYVSNLECFGDIIFTMPNAISRGGILSAKGKIEAKIVGSTAGVATILKVPKDGEITADIVYNNTTFYFGERSYTLELPSKNIKAYVDKKGEIIVEKFVL